MPLPPCLLQQVLAANPPSTGVNCIAATRGLRWLFTAGDDGLVRKYDFWGSMNGKARLTASQMQGLPESLNKVGRRVCAMTSGSHDISTTHAQSAVLLGSIENEESTRATTLSTVPTTSSMELDAAMEENNDDNAVATAAADDAHSPTDGNATSNHGLSPVLCMDIHSEAVWGVTGTMNGAVNLFTIRHDQGTIVHVLKHHTDAVSTMRIMPGQQALLTGAWDRTLAITDLNTGQLVSRFMAHKSNVTAVELRPCTGQTGDVDSDGNVFLSASYDGQCLVWDRRASEKPAYVFAAVAPCPPWALSVGRGVRRGTKLMMMRMI